MDLSKRLKTGTTVRTWNYEEENMQGQTIAVKDSTGEYKGVFHIESVVCSDGVIDRIVIKKSRLAELGFVIVEE